ncbi:non-homologous end joining protein Ku [Haloechinothrix halophila]|uniref:non-homologous end joining protein Ku n=1 Tax=Haloechinothrix halophila TaxID=1069073 RepID=UPI0004299C28|nr:Ku protein [Haloechinothrix halophila]
MRAMWKGTISFGLVTIPIKLYAATEAKNVSFRQVHASDGGRIQYKRVCSIDGDEVPYSDIAKGYELDSGDMVVLTSEDMAQLPLSSSHSIDVMEFVPLDSVDPLYFDRGYYLEPDKAAAKPYVLLRDALADSGKVAIVKIALRQRESLALLRVADDVLVLQTMLWPDEVRTPDFGFLEEEEPEVRPDEMSMAGMLIESLSSEVFEPDKHHDEYRAAVLSLVQAKAEGQEVFTAPESESSEVIDLMTALQASVDSAGSAGSAGSSGKSGSSGGSGSARKSSNGGRTASDGQQSTRKSGSKSSSSQSSGGGKSKQDSKSKSSSTSKRTKSPTSKRSAS